MDQRWDIVCVQETWLSATTQYATELHLHQAASARFHPGFKPVWAHRSIASDAVSDGEEAAEAGQQGAAALADDAAPSQAPSEYPSQPTSPPGPQPRRRGRAKAGVGFLFNKALLASEALRLLGVPQQHASGRLITQRVAWEGHTLMLGCVYLSSGEPGEQRSFIEQHLRPLAAAHGDRLVVMGDWNWAPEVRLDRLHRPRGTGQMGGEWRRGPRDGPAGLPDTLTAARFAAACPTLRDVYRDRHPDRATFTYQSSEAASRLDRFYVSAALMPHVERCGVLPAVSRPGASGRAAADPAAAAAAAVASALSDHRPIFLHLRPRRPRAIGTGVLPGVVQRRVRLHHCSVRALVHQMEAWLEEEVAAATEFSPAQLLQWWPGFKLRAAAKAKALDAQAATTAAQRSAEVKDSAAAYAAACQRVEREGPGALPALVEARRTCARAARQEASEGARSARQEWLHAGERPCPLLTELTRPPASSRYIPCLRAAAGGGLLVEGPLMAKRMADFFAGVSTAPAPDGAALAEVVSALRAEGRTVANADAVGAAEVPTEEVETALRKSKQGKAPGPDGLPPFFWRRYSHQLSSVLAAVFSAIGSVGQMPEGFTLGVIRALPKPAMPDGAEPTSYRPITLLNSDYRLLARILASRLGPALTAAIDPAQMAFLPGRLIGENVLFLQLLPDMLRSGAASGDANGAAGGRSAAVAFLDFAKAYDTVSRPFLLAAMEAMGAGEGLLRWVRLLLQDTQAAADVNGWVSQPVLSTAGVRQGCPLSPALYLFVAQALWSFLRARGHGIQLCGQLVGGVQFADDAEVLLPAATEEAVAPFLVSMDVFQRASNQHLNRSKCRLLPVGLVAAAHPPAGAQGGGQPHQLVCGLPVMGAASALGIRFSNDPAAAGADWEALVSGVEAAYGRLARLPLSSFGRGFGASSYGISKLMYHAEFNTWPEQVVDRLQRAGAKLVDRGLAPSTRVRALPGVPTALLAGPPREGGFGLLPWMQHVKARHAWWGARLVRALAAPPGEEAPWVLAASAILSHLSGKAAHPAVVLLATVAEQGGSELPLTVVKHGLTQRRLPGPLVRLVRGMRTLGRLGPTQRGAGPPPACAAAPLWGNPLLPAVPASNLALLEGMGTLAGAVGWWHRIMEGGWEAEVAGMQPQPLIRLGQSETQARWEHWWPRRVPGAATSGLLRPLFSNRADCMEQFQALRASVPASWWAAAEAVHHSPAAEPRPTPQAALSATLGTLAWRRPSLTHAGGELVVQLSALSVKAGTQLQMGPVEVLRAERHSVFVAAALELPAVDSDRVEELRSTLQRAWKLKWENTNKEVWWRMTVQGVRGVGGHGIATSYPCPCGGLAAGAHSTAALAHHFWDCPVAAAVVTEMQRAWDGTEGRAGGGGIPLRRQDVWLLQPPSGQGGDTLHVGAWTTVGLAALSAMDHGRRAMTAMRLERAEGEGRERARQRQRGRGRGQMSLHQAWGLPEPAPAAAEAPAALPDLPALAGQKAVTRFWSLLTDFAELPQTHESWDSLPSSRHPFLVRTLGGGMRVELPAIAAPG